MTITPISLLPELQGWQVPPPSSIPDLTDLERMLISGLSSRLTLQAPAMRQAQSYYEGTQLLANLGISVPPQFAGLRVIVDWPRIAVDPLVQRCVVDGFRLPGTTQVDSEMASWWQANGMDSESSLCWLDAFVCGRGYMVVGSPDVKGDAPLITVESPLNMSVRWSPRTRKADAAYQIYEVEGYFHAALYLPNETVTMYREDMTTAPWQILNRDQHNMGEVPVYRFANRARSANREGFSEISAAVMNTTDSACRTLLAMEIAREFYAIPHKYILGATESDYVNPDGSAKSAIDMVMSKFLAFERDDEGNLPTVGQFNAFDPSVFTKIVDKHGQLMSSYTQFPPEWFGMTAQSNPASADAIRVAQDGVDRRAGKAQDQFSDPLENVMRSTWRFANDGKPVPPEFMQMETDWVDVAAPTPMATSEAIWRQSQAGAVTPNSDVILKRLGYSAVEREKLAADADAANELMMQVGDSLAAKASKIEDSVLKEVDPAVGSPAGI